MPSWKKNIFVNAISTRMTTEGRTAEDIIMDYPALSDAEKSEILTAINAG
ncbi:MAG: hypothetical protein K0R84_1460 [Clostridia bacterium]|jgi:hypothetical protein|nr:hypothetical protein [Clostridia bacterium]